MLRNFMAAFARASLLPDRLLPLKKPEKEEPAGGKGKPPSRQGRRPDRKLPLTAPHEMKPTILLVDDDVNLNRLLSNFLAKNGFEVESAFSGEEALKNFGKRKFDLLLTDLRLPSVDGLQLLQWNREHHPQSATILMTSYADVQTAVKAMKLGAFDYIAKPIVPDDLIKKIQEAVSAAKESRQRTQGNDSPAASQPHPGTLFFSEGFVQGVSEISAKLREHIRLVAPTPISVLISGESGTGKEYIARLIHLNGKQSEGPFIAVDCGSIPKDLAGSELFGHKKGSFTGALADKTGFFQQAEGGTLFFDEIENLPASVQIYLLRALQERKIRPVGGEKDLETRVRVIAATNENLQSLCEKGLFRTDLFHRLNEFSIHVPPLRERKDDILLFARHFLQNANEELEKEKPVSGFSKETESLLLGHPWPGNIRELAYTVRRACLLCKGSLVEKEELPAELLHRAAAAGNENPASTPSARISLAEEDKERILSCLRQVNYNKTKAARLLNMDRKTLYNKLKSYGIDL